MLHRGPPLLGQSVKNNRQGQAEWPDRHVWGGGREVSTDGQRPSPFSLRELRSPRPSRGLGRLPGPEGRPESRAFLP